MGRRKAKETSAGPALGNKLAAALTACESANALETEIAACMDQHLLALLKDRLFEAAQGEELRKLLDTSTTIPAIASPAPANAPLVASLHAGGNCSVGSSMADMKHIGIAGRDPLHALISERLFESVQDGRLAALLEVSSRSHCTKETVSYKDFRFLPSAGTWLGLRRARDVQAQALEEEEEEEGAEDSSDSDNTEKKDKKGKKDKKQKG